MPEVIEDFFLQAGPAAGVIPRETGKGQPRLPRRPGAAHAVADRRAAGAAVRPARPRVQAGRLRQEPAGATTRRSNGSRPGIPLFEAVREETLERAQNDLRQGAVFYDLHRSQPSRLDVYSAAVHDGRGHLLHRRLFVVEVGAGLRTLTLRQPTIFLDLRSPAAWRASSRPTFRAALPRLCPVGTRSSRRWSSRPCSRSSKKWPPSDSGRSRRSPGTWRSA